MYLKEAKKVFDKEIEALESVKDNLGENFLAILDKIVNCKGKIIITGMGKPGHIGRKIAATLSSLGTPAFFLHPAEALHGDLGMVQKKDVVIAISNSGESEEIKMILSNIKLIGAFLIGISGNRNSTLIKHSDLYEVFPKITEAGYLGLAPTSSTTVELVYGDALAIVASKIYGFDSKKYGLYHPAGSLGKKLLFRVKDLMLKNKEDSNILIDTSLKEALIEMGSKGLGIVAVVNKAKILQGIITDGDIRRQLEKGVDIYNLMVNEIMTRKPITFDMNMLAVEALEKMKANNISSGPVLNADGSHLGIIRLQEILKAGIVI